MAYEPGEQKIFYQAAGFQTGLTITAKFYTQNNIWTPLIALTELGEGLYYFVYTFQDIGPYLILVYENGQAAKSSVLRIEAFGLRWYKI